MSQIFDFTRPFEAHFFRLLRTPEGRPLERGDTALIEFFSRQKYPVINGIPRFVQAPAPSHGQRLEISADTPITLGWADEVGGNAGSGSTKVILDAGCGDGRYTARLARSNPNALVIGLDPSTNIEGAFDSAVGIPNVRFVQGYLRAPPLLTRSVDSIHFFGAPYSRAEMRGTLLALSQLLANGGEILFDFPRNGPSIDRLDVRLLLLEAGLADKGSVETPTHLAFRVGRY